MLSAAAVQTAIRKANLSFNVILELGSAGVERVRLFVCGGDFLEVFVEAVRVGDSHLVDGLFPSGDFPAFDKAAS